MSEITMYVVENKAGDTVAFDEGTFDYREAKEAAQRERGLVIAREYEYQDSYVVDDFTAQDSEGECRISSDLSVSNVDGWVWCSEHDAPATNLTDTKCEEVTASEGEGEALYSLGVSDGRIGLSKRHDSAQYDQGYAEGERLASPA